MTSYYGHMKYTLAKNEDLSSLTVQSFTEAKSFVIIIVQHFILQKGRGGSKTYVHGNSGFLKLASQEDFHKWPMM